MFSKIKLLYQNKYFKIGDLILIIILLALSFIPASLFIQKQIQPKKETQTIAYIRVNNRTIKKFALNRQQNFTWTYKNGNERNVVQVIDNKIRVRDADCKDQVCVKQGWKSKPGQSIVCLPHKFLIEIKSTHDEHPTKSKKPTSKKDFDNTLVNP